MSSGIDYQRCVLEFLRRAWSIGEQDLLNTLDELCAPEASFHIGSHPQTRTLPEFQRLVRLVKQGQPDLSYRVEGLISAGPEVVARLSFRGTHTGHLAGLVPPTRRGLTLTEMIHVVIDDQGRLRELWHESDFHGLLVAAGAVPPLDAHPLRQVLTAARSLVRSALSPPPVPAELSPVLAREAPGPRGYPVVGVGPDLARDLVGTFTRAWREHGDVVRFPLPGSRRLFLVNHPDHVRQVLEYKQPIYPKDPLSVGKFEPFVGNGLFTSNGEFHFRQRRLAQPVFKGARVASYAPVMVTAAGELAHRWRDERVETVDLTPEMMRLALDIVMRTVFSADLGGRTAEIADAVRTCNAHTNARLQRFVELPGTRLTPAHRRFVAARALVDGFVHDLIQRRRRDPADRDDMLSRLLSAGGRGMTDQHVRDEIVTIFLGGYETTALSLVWTFSLLSRHPAVEDAVRAELSEIVGGRPVADSDLPRLSYLRMVYQEALRLYPPVWTMSRSPIEDDVLGGCRIPRGSQVFISPYLLHRHPEFWDNPEGFQPERFARQRATQQPLYSYMPFSRGPRLCPGASIALFEAPLVIARLLQSYRLQLRPGHLCTPTSNVFLYPEGGMPMALVPLKDG
ncbi:cytochrome P450 [Lentzea atacamensis]|uniref:Cytochrome P450 n=2 Tax=Lentzea TaxID=165301 RepID=A0A316HXW7_9PSEU|nr:cytochrome P450 [Lentzea atacamensis]PWK84858.1 cytochrome P450 [Lentzea atacamensis]